MYAPFFLEIINPVEVNLSGGYLFGAIIALFILVYLLWSLVKPEKF
jgi:K+-transporting ATPase KdpF subunit